MSRIQKYQFRFEFQSTGYWNIYSAQNIFTLGIHKGDIVLEDFKC